MSNEFEKLTFLSNLCLLISVPTIGKWNSLTIIDRIDNGLLLDGEELGSLLMPNKYVYTGCEIGEEANVFVYPDSSDRLIATTERPHATAGEFAFLECVETNRIGAFFDMGLAKDLLVPFAEQQHRINEGYPYVLHLYVDEVSQRLVGSTKLHKFLNQQGNHYDEDQEVDILVYEETDIGFKVIVNHHDRGIIYHNEIFQKVTVGQKLTAFVFLVRPDGKLDLCLHPPAEKKVDTLNDRIIGALKENGGSLPLSDKSSAEIISDTFQCSKKTFKRSLGALYKQKLITISKEEIKLVTE